MIQQFVFTQPFQKTVCLEYADCPPRTPCLCVEKGKVIFNIGDTITGEILGNKQARIFPTIGGKQISLVVDYPGRIALFDPAPPPSSSNNPPPIDINPNFPPASQGNEPSPYLPNNPGDYGQVDPNIDNRQTQGDDFEIATEEEEVTTNPSLSFWQQFLGTPWWVFLLFLVAAAYLMRDRLQKIFK